MLTMSMLLFSVNSLEFVPSVLSCLQFTQTQHMQDLIHLQQERVTWRMCGGDGLDISIIYLPFHCVVTDME